MGRGHDIIHLYEIFTGPTKIGLTKVAEYCNLTKGIVSSGILYYVRPKDCLVNDTTGSILEVTPDVNNNNHKKSWSNIEKQILAIAVISAQYQICI